jgi:hypothetical protein
VYDIFGEFCKLDSMLPKKRGQTPKDRAHEIEGALDWIHSNGVSPHDEDDVEKLNKLPPVPVSRHFSIFP